MKIEYLEAEDITNIVDTEMVIYESAISIFGDKAEKKDIDKLIGVTAAAISLNFSKMIDFIDEGSREDLEGGIKALLNHGRAGEASKIEIKERIVRLILGYLYRSLHRLSGSLERRKNEVDNASIEVGHFIDKISASIDGKKG